jgi:N-carbamoylputrescine amidase
MAPITLATIQLSLTADRDHNVAKVIDRVEAAAAQGAQIILIPELFESLYFPQLERGEFFGLANSIEDHPFIHQFQSLAAKLKVVLPLSFFEKAGQAHYNSLVTIDATGEILGLYRKSHIPDGPGYEEKYYFNPGDTGFKAFKTRYGTIGTGICWDQWYPEAARCMALLGADLLLYPTAIGSEPAESGTGDTKDMWQRVMIGHAVANACYLGAANRVGQEADATFYGSSFICDFRGDTLAEADRNRETILYSILDFEVAQRFRASMGFFRDRRPTLYGPILTLDGQTPAR